MKKSFSVAIFVLALWVVLAWFLGIWLGVNPLLIWYLRGGLWLIGIAGFAGYIVLGSQPGSAANDGPFQIAAAEIDSAFAEASKLMQKAKGVKQINTLPAFFLLGDKGAAKTSSLTKSGIDPELMGATGTLNVWYARQTLFVDAAGKAMADSATRKKLFRKFAPAESGHKNSSTRSAVLVVDCELFMKVGSASAIAEKTHEYQTILSELADELGCSLPVYVLFSKADKIPHFREYSENLSGSEASEVLGVSLPVPAVETLQPNSELQTQRIITAFKSIAWALADRRPLYLAREQSTAKLSDIYEFPREFSKLRPVIVEFLVDLCRQSLSPTAPFLRGFYFTGERTASPVEAAVPMYISRLFSDVFLSDRAASASTPARRKTSANSVLRWLQVSVASIALLLSVWFFISFYRNYTMLQEAVEDSRLSATDSFERLSRMRDTLAQLNDFERNGPPWTYTALLYKGGDILVPLRTSYYAMFRRMLLEPTQQTMVKICANPKAYDAQGYQFIYEALKAYLITTIHHEKSVPASLTPILLRHWRNHQPVGVERENLARQSFAFYTQELVQGNPYSTFTRLDSSAVASARAYLNAFQPEERIYKELLLSAAGRGKPIVFNEDYPGTSATVVNEYRVEPWFTKSGYQHFQHELLEVDKYINGESWVLGIDGPRIPDKRKLVDTLRLRFNHEFVAAWSGFLTATTLVPFDGVPDAATKMRSLSSPMSAMLLDLCVASENTSVDSSDVKQAFQPIQFISPSGCLRQPVSATAVPYVGSLNELAIGLTAVGPVSQARSDDVRMAMGMTRVATVVATQLIKGFRTDRGHSDSTVVAKTSQLLKEPITRAESLLKGVK